MTFVVHVNMKIILFLRSKLYLKKKIEKKIIVYISIRYY